MRFPRYLSVLFLSSLFGSCLLGQGLNTTASKDDWEEINFEFNSAILTDGYPSLLRLAELLQKHPDYKVKVEGHADRVGSNAYNDKLAARRADAVQAFLTKYGAGANQVTTASQGKRTPKVDNRTKEGRFMNRRVMLTVTDATGKVVADGPIAEVIKAVAATEEQLKKCCDDILKRLDRLDEIADLLRGMKGENDSLRKELADLRKQQADLDAYVKGLPKPLTSQETSSIVDARTAEQIERARMPRYSIVNLNAGADSNGELTFTGRGRLFMPFKEQLAVQMQGEYMYFKDRQEGQADIGVVARFLPRAQAGFFGSFKNVNFTGREPGRSIFSDNSPTDIQFRQLRGNGTLGQASATIDYLFSRGRIGIFGAKGFLTDVGISRTAISRNIFEETYLRVIDQIGASTTLGLAGNTYMEGNLGYLRSFGGADRPGGTLRFVFPLSDRFAFTVEGGMNETLLARENTGRVVAGFQFGNFMRPKDYLEGYNGVQHAVPADIPRVRFEALTRRVRTGNDAPVADAGPDQIGVTAGTITLNGSGSFDPDGDPITFRWDQIAGPSVSISGQSQAVATFTAAEGQSYSFRLTVKDDKGLQGIARVTVTTTQQGQVQIVRFQASPAAIRSGQSSTIDWQVLNADTVTITELGNVDPKNGTRVVTPTRTTQYRLTARNRVSEASATTTIQVEERPEPVFLACTVSPMNIIAGESATITYATQNADTVSISGIGDVDRSGSRTVSPTQSTTYTLTATNTSGTASCTLNVQVTPGAVPRIIRFVANPIEVTQGGTSNLQWAVENAETVTISTLGNVDPTGTRGVTPQQTTTYTLTARNRFGEVSATAQVTVTPPVVPPNNPPTVTACTATPSTSAKPGDPVVLNYTTTNAVTVQIPGVSGVGLQGPVTVNPTATTTYTVTAVSSDNRTATCTIAVTVTPTPPPIAIITGPSVVETIYRELTLDGSASTNPAGGPLTYIWEPLGTGTSVLDQGQAKTRIQIGGLFGDYIFRLRVRNAAGQEDSTTVTVRFRSTVLF